MATLVHTTSGRRVNPGGVTVLGRSTRAQVELEHPKVSSVHARVGWTGEVWTLRDLASRNGTQVNGERLEPGVDRVLRAGDRISFGSAEETWTVLDLQPPSVRRSTQITQGAVEATVLIRLGVSRDEEQTELVVQFSGHTHVIPSRSHHYLLVLLARQRLDDAAEGVEEGLAGWVMQEHLERQLKMTGKALNVQIHRARKELEALGVPGASKVVERRRGTGQLRLGFAEVSVVPQEVDPP